MDLKLRFVDVRRDRQGRVRYFYVRRNGRLWRIKGMPPSKEFFADYARLLKETEPAKPRVRRGYADGSFGAVVTAYFESAAFKEKKEATRKEYRRILESLVDEHSDKPMIELERRHIRRIRDARAETPGAANNVLRMMKIICNFAVEDGIVPHSPAANMKELKVGEWRAWTDDELEAFESRWKPGTMQRRAFALALYTGQRKGDLVAMTWAHRKDDRIRVIQGKTDAELWVPEHPELTDELDRASRESLTMLTTSEGKAFDPVYAGAWFADAIEAAGLPDDCVLHGLRKTAARMLAEAGCTEREIMAITGHVTSRMVSKYVKDASQIKRAERAIEKMRKNARRTRRAAGA